MIYGNDPTPFAGCVVLHPSADSTPAPTVVPVDGLDLRVRMMRAVHSLDILIEEARGKYERERLTGKRSGVALAVTYLDEALRGEA